MMIFLLKIVYKGGFYDRYWLLQRDVILADFCREIFQFLKMVYKGGFCMTWSSDRCYTKPYPYGTHKASIYADFC